MRAAGLSAGEVDAAIARGFRDGRYRAPRRTGVAYMLSPETRFHNPETGRIEPGRPHLMFYAPYLRNREIGSPGEPPRDGGMLPFVIGEGTPHAYIVVFVDPGAGQTVPGTSGPAGAL